MTTQLQTIPFQSGWKMLATTAGNLSNYSAVGYNDSSWAPASGAFGSYNPGGVPDPSTVWNTSLNPRLWLRRTVPEARNYQVKIRVDDTATIYWNGVNVLTYDSSGPDPIESGWLDIPDRAVNEGTQVIAVNALDTIGTSSYIDVAIRYDAQLGSEGVFKLLDNNGDWWVDSCCYAPPGGFSSEGTSLIFAHDADDSANWSQFTAFQEAGTGRYGGGFRMVTSANYMHKDLAQHYPTMTAGFAVKVPSLSGTQGGSLFAFRSGWGDRISAEIAMNSSAPQNTLIIYGAGGQAGGNVLGTIPTAFAANTWAYIEITCTVAAGLDGHVGVRVNNALVFSGPGNTKSGIWGNLDGVTFSGLGNTHYIDDIYVAIGSTFYGDQGDAGDGYSAPNDSSVSRPLKVRTENDWTPAFCLTKLEPVATVFGYVTRIQYGFGCDFVHPSSLEVGDLMLVTVCSYWPISNESSGWTNILSSGTIGDYQANGRTDFKIAQPSDIGGTTDYLEHGNNFQACGVMQILRGVNQSNPIHSATKVYNGGGFPQTNNAITNGSSPRAAVHMLATRGSNAPITLSKGTQTAQQNDDRMSVVANQEALLSGETTQCLAFGTYVGLGAPGTNLMFSSVIVNGT